MGKWTAVSDGKTRTKSQEGAATARPPLFKVVMHNDDYTTMEFVVEMLQTVFHKSATEANHIMLRIHVHGRGICGTYPYEIAETKVHRVHGLAQAAGYPLRCSAEPA